MYKDFRDIETPFYYYDTALLQATLDAICKEIKLYPNFHVHYALKANANPKILPIIQRAGLGVDCVSGGEIQTAIDAHFPTNSIVYAGVGKTDKEIILGLRNRIFCFNVESIPELEVINELAAKENIDNIQMQELSMGMSRDFDLAARYGATMVRVGSRLFQ